MPEIDPHRGPRAYLLGRPRSPWPLTLLPLFLFCSKQKRQHVVGMYMQGAFDFWRDSPLRPKRPERLFFGLFPDNKISNSVGYFTQRFLRENHLEGMPLKTARLHVSLHHVGDYKRLETKFIYAAKQAGKAVSMPAFEVVFRSIRSFEGPQPAGSKPRRLPLVLLGEGDALLELHKSLGTAMEKNGLKIAEHFMPHMTLFYGRKPVAPQPIEPISFIVREFTLIHSELWLTKYNIISSWPLEG